LPIFFGFSVYERIMLRSADLAVAQTAAINAIFFGEMVYLLNVRGLRNTLEDIGLFSNMRLPGGVGLMAVLQGILSHAGFMNRILGAAPLVAMPRLLIMGASLAICLFVALMKWHDRHGVRKTGRASKIQSKEWLSSEDHGRYTDNSLRCRCGNGPNG
jgi:hypothetical protein